MGPVPARRLPALAAVAAVLWLAGNVLRAAPSPSLEDVVERLDRYLAAYEPRLSAVVADEEYEQWLSGFISSGRRAMRILQSEFLFTRLHNGAPWSGFRDTVTVDCHPVRDLSSINISVPK